MTFEPIRVANITADGTTIAHYMAALHRNITSDGAVSATVSVGGSGYTVGDIIEDSSGTGTSSRRAQFRVETLTGSAVATVSVWEVGEYTVDATNPVATTAITFVGAPDDLCTLTITYGALSTWTVVDATEIDTASPGPGSYSLALRSPDTLLEVCIINDGTQAAPSTDDARVGLNPDGLSDPIVDSRTPWDDCPNFSGDSLANMRRSWEIDPEGQSIVYSTQFLWWEWDDAVCQLNKDTARTYCPSGFIAGKILVPPYDHLADSGAVRLDGHAVLGSKPTARFPTDFDKSARWLHSYSSTNAKRSFIRTGTGQLMSTGSSAGWRYAVAGPFAFAQGTLQHRLGPSAEYVPTLWTFGFANAGNLSYEWTFRLKYCLSIELTSTFTLLRSGGEDIALAISSDNTDTLLALPVPDNFIVNP